MTLNSQHRMRQRERAWQGFPRPLLLLAILCLSIACSELKVKALADTAQPSATDRALVDKGKVSYVMYCQACHGEENTTIDSPSNLFDAKWHHGDSPASVEETVRNGILEKGMPGWGAMISDAEIQSIIAYLFSFQTKPESSHE